jgi:DNA-binding response OmpR family regulator
MEGINKKILIIEDEKFLLEMYDMRLKKAGFEVLTASEGKSGIHLACEQKPDLIVLDIVMPEMSGYEVLRMLKKDPDTRHIPVLVFSNLGQDEEISKGLDLGADDYIVKTEVTPTQLVDKINKVLEGNNKI